MKYSKLDHKYVSLKVKFEILTVTSVRMAVFWDVATCCTVDTD
jgi:hypothetical protein